MILGYLSWPAACSPVTRARHGWTNGRRAPDEELWGTMWSVSINKSTNDEGEMIILLAESQHSYIYKLATGDARDTPGHRRGFGVLESSRSRQRRGWNGFSVQCLDKMLLLLWWMGPECPSSWFGWVDMSAVGKINVLLSLAAEQMFSDRWTSAWCNMCRETFSNQHKQQIKTCSLLIIQQSCRLLQRFPSLPLCYRQFKLPIYRSRREATGQIIDTFPSGGLGMISCVGIGTAQQWCVMRTQSLDNLFYSEIAENCSAP